MWGGKFSIENFSFFNLFLVALGLGGFESCMCSYLTVAVCCVSRCNNLSQAAACSKVQTNRTVSERAITASQICAARPLGSFRPTVATVSWASFRYITMLAVYHVGMFRAEQSWHFVAEMFLR
jgi:hypothetical protein